MHAYVSLFIYHALYNLRMKIISFRNDSLLHHFQYIVSIISNSIEKM